ncbi:hypothetical protein ACETK8_19895 (plasmid) [Brevundimonas staleyi]|uniref:ATP-grasp domain-containing protein n=1 Tax=Brevundimonas staleyi TaxID=74326 RepID=A0ABW0FMH5_9CAUL
MSLIPVAFGFREDPHLQRAALALEALGQSLWFMDSTTPGRCTFAWTRDTRRAGIDVVDRTGSHTRTVAPDEMFVWLRNKAQYQVLRTLATQINRFKLEERSSFIRGLIEAYDIPHMNALDRGRRQEDKVLQTRFVAQTSLSLPETLVSSDRDEILAFLERHPVAITKPLWVKYLPEARSGAPARFIGTRKVTAEIVAQASPDDFLIAPMIIQPLLPKQYELRVIASRGNGAVAYKIEAPETDQGRLDWRPVTDACRNALIEAPDDMVEGLVRYLEAAGLEYGVFDLIMTPDGELYFLECNSDGQWAWLEQGDAPGPTARLFADILSARTH